MLKPKATTWFSKEYMQDRNGMYTNEELIEKAFTINAWMNRNPENEWVQTYGRTVINSLNSLYTKETLH